MLENIFKLNEIFINVLELDNDQNIENITKLNCINGIL